MCDSKRGAPSAEVGIGAGGHAASLQAKIDKLRDSIRYLTIAKDILTRSYPGELQIDIQSMKKAVLAYERGATEILVSLLEIGAGEPRTGNITTPICEITEQSKRTKQWRERNPDAYREYMKAYMREYRRRKREDGKDGD